MKLSVRSLLGDGVALELPNEGGEPDRLELARGVNVHGTYAHDQTTVHLQKMGAEELDWKRIAYFLGAGGSFAAQPLALRGVELDALVARGPLKGRARFAGHVSAREVHGKAVQINLGPSPATPQSPWCISAATVEAAATRYAHDAAAGQTASAVSVQATALAVSVGSTASHRCAQLQLTNAALRQATGGALTVSCGSIEARDGRVKAGHVTVAFESISASGAKLTSREGGVDFETSSMEVRGLELTVGDAVIKADRLHLPLGLAFVRERLTIGEASAVHLLFDVPRLRRHGTESAAAPRPDEPATTTGLMDWSFLDGLYGQLDVDLHVDAKIPIIKRRRAVHKFRVAIDAGVINYRALEHDLSLLEDAVLDLHVEGDRLILEKDIPLIPFDNETLVFWPLDAEARALAEKHLVRLRTLVDAQLPDKPEKKNDGSDKKPAFELTKLDMEAIAAQLKLPGPARLAFKDGSSIHIGAEGRVGIGELRLGGAVRHRPGQPSEPGELTLAVTDVYGGLHRLPVGERMLSAVQIEIDAVEEARVVMDGLAPSEARALLKGMLLRDVVLEPRPAHGAQPQAAGSGSQPPAARRPAG